MGLVRTLAWWGSALLAGLLLGLGATALLLSPTGMGGSVRSGPWSTSLVIGSPDADPWTRARVAWRGLLALAPEETLYYSASTDSDRRPLDGSCRYRLEGWDPGARWWSITAYGADNYLIPNAANRYSVSQSSIARRQDRSWTVVVGPDTTEGNWLPVAAGKPFDLTLRLYNPETDVYAEPEAAHLPTITREACR